MEFSERNMMSYLLIPNIIIKTYFDHNEIQEMPLNGLLY